MVISSFYDFLFLKILKLDDRVKACLKINDIVILLQ